MASPKLIGMQIKTTSFKRGFTLIELLVVIAIIGLLSSITLASLSTARDKSKVAAAKVQLKSIQNAVHMLNSDTGLDPDALELNYCTNDQEANRLWQYNKYYLNSCDAGLVCNSGIFSNWKGPYMSSAPLDPWGTHYYFDSYFTCGAGIDGCKGNTGQARVIQSFGPNKTQEYTSGDDIVTLLCIDPAPTR